MQTPCFGPRGDAHTHNLRSKPLALNPATHAQKPHPNANPLLQTARRRAYAQPAQQTPCLEPDDACPETAPRCKPLASDRATMRIHTTSEANPLHCSPRCTSTHGVPMQPPCFKPRANARVHSLRRSHIASFVVMHAHETASQRTNHARIRAKKSTYKQPHTHPQCVGSHATIT